MTASDSPHPQDHRRAEEIQPPPSTFGGILRQIGPGLIIAANIVGSGELIMTTKSGANAGIALLWLIILGCVIKVFVQLELGRFSISHGETSLAALNGVPGPRFRRINWVVLFWALMMLSTIGQMGGIVGGVSQALAVTMPFTGDYREMARIPIAENLVELAEYETGRSSGEDLTPAQTERQRQHLAWIKRDLEALENHEELITQAQRVARSEPESAEHKAELKSLTEMTDPPTKDDAVWAIIVAVFTSIVLYLGRYRLIERISVVLVVAFTFITVGNVVQLQSTQYAISSSQFLKGLMFGIPEGSLTVALATFGIIGVGATELVAYPYWCLEKGYAKSAGPRDDSEAWLARAIGWFRVMKYDAFASMVIYTVSTAAFFLMGVAVLHSEGRDPENHRLVTTLAESYRPVFGDYARLLFLAGAIAVLYSTYLVGNASNARVISDFTGIAGLSDRQHDSKQRQFLVRVISFLLPLVCVAIYLFFKAPVLLIMIGGICQNTMLPILGISAIYFRYRQTDPRLRPARVWDVALITSCFGLLITGSWGLYEVISNLVNA